MKVKCIGWYGSCCIHLCVCLHGELFDGLQKTCKRFELKRKQSKYNPRKSLRCVVLKWIGKNCLQEAEHYFVNTKGQTKWSIFESFVKSHWPSSVTSTHWVVLGLPAQCKEGLVSPFSRLTFSSISLCQFSLGVVMPRLQVSLWLAAALLHKRGIKRTVRFTKALLNAWNKLCCMSRFPQ